jgi:phosphoglucosamine mutase
MRKYFGTDGIRGKVGQTPITPDFMMHLAYAVGSTLKKKLYNKEQRPTVLIGKDTRLSGYMLESALEAGFLAAGVDTILCGPLPTPAIAYLTRALRLQAGVVISASHNPYYDNGIKFFDAYGNKLSDEMEANIELLLENPIVCVEPQYFGKAKRLDDANGRYIEFCKSTFPNNLNLKDIKLVLDCANGASYKVAPKVFHELGATVVVTGNEPNGININDKCGATHTSSFQELMKQEQYKGYLGLSFDGDADRLMMVDDTGKLYNGDELLYVLATQYGKFNTTINGVVGTVMTNMGIEQALNKQNIALVRAKVGDRYVLEQLHEHKWIYGGEGSGHLLCLDKHTTGDAIIAALQVLSALQLQNITLRQALNNVVMYEQVLINLEVTKQFNYASAPKDMHDKINDIEHSLNANNTGRVLIRMSGTEPKLRIMVEAQNHELAFTSANNIAHIIKDQVMNQIGVDYLI